MHYPKHELIERLGEPAEENVRADLRRPGRQINVLRWNCECGADRDADEALWSWEPCSVHKPGAQK